MIGRVSLALLVAANLLPLFGVLFWDWDVFFLLLLFWCENVIIGLFGIARIVVSATTENTFEGLFLPLFFLVHYGGFMFGHFMVLFFMYSESVTDGGGVAEPADYYRIVIENLNWVVLVALFASHGWSFVENFITLQANDDYACGPDSGWVLPDRDGSAACGPGFAYTHEDRNGRHIPPARTQTSRRPHLIEPRESHYVSAPGTTTP